MNKLECGRSLVEMLGILAVMGVIGMAGLSAFNHAMNNHRANEVLYEVSKRAYGCMGFAKIGDYKKPARLAGIFYLMTKFTNRPGT